jgi:hypothetical protein
MSATTIAALNGPAEAVDPWGLLTDEDREHLIGPPKVDFDTHSGFDDREAYLQWCYRRIKWIRWWRERHPPRCFVCGGRTVHSEACRQLRQDEWAPRVTSISAALP